MSEHERWEALQARFAAGETLTPEEERARHEQALGDPLAERERALFAELRARGEGVDEVPQGLLERVLSAVGARPRLHLLAPGERPPAALHSPSRARRLWLASAAVAVSAGAVAAGFAVFTSREQPLVAVTSPPTQQPARAELVLASGEVTVPEGTRVGGRQLTTGDRVRTGEGRACLGVDPGIDVCLGAQSEIVVDSLRADGVRIRVERGTALAALTRRERGHTFSLTTGGVDVTAHGTVFAVERRASDALDVVVMEGSVAVERDTALEALVSAHFRLTLERGAPRREPEAIGRGEEARFWALLAARELWAKPELGVLEVGAGEPGLEVAVDREAPLTLPFRAFVPAGRRSIALRTASGNEVTSAVDVVAGETSVVDPNALRSKRPGADPATGADESVIAPSAAALLARARKELAAGNARGALAVYERLRATHPASPEARTVLVTIGKLELDSKQPARALKSFDAYLGAPGPLAPEALAGKIRALRALGRTANEKRAIESYLSRFPDGFESPLLEQRLEVLQGK